MKFRKLIIRLVFFCLIGFILNILTADALAESKRDWIKADRYYPRLQWKEFYQLPEDSIKVLVTGSSRSFYGIDPYIITRKCGMASFNLGSPHQPLSTTYYLLKEAFRYQKIKYVVLELHYEMLTRTYTRPYKYYVFENMKNSWNKLDYFIEGFNFSEKLYYLFPMLDRRSNLDYILKKIRGRSEEQFTEDEEYLGKGFVSSGELLDVNKSDKPSYKWSDSAVSAEARQYYPKIAKLVNQHNARLIIVNFPYPEIVNIVDEEEFSADYHRFIAQEEGVILVDYQINKLNFPLDEYFDVHHLNKWGAERLSEDLGEKINDLVQ